MNEIVLKLINDFLLRKGHHLNNESARAAHRIILVDENTKTHRRGNLLARCKVPCQVLCNLARAQIDCPGIRLLEPHVLDDRERTLSDTACDIEMPGVDHRCFCRRNPRIPFYIASIVRCDNQALHRARAADLHRQQVRVILKHVSHHDACRQESSKCRRHGRPLPVDSSCFIHKIFCRRGECANLRLAFVIRCRCRGHTIILISHVKLLASIRCLLLSG